MHDLLNATRRKFIGTTAAGLLTTGAGLLQAQTGPSISSSALKTFGPARQIVAGELEIGYIEVGSPAGTPVLLLHGFPYSIDSYIEVAPVLASRGCRVIVPFLRGHGSTRFRLDSTPRSGQQAAIGLDVIALLDALQLPRAVLAGYDWGGRAACVAAALWPERWLDWFQSTAISFKTLRWQTNRQLRRSSRGFGTSTFFRLSAGAPA